MSGVYRALFGLMLVKFIVVGDLILDPSFTLTSYLISGGFDLLKNEFLYASQIFRTFADDKCSHDVTAAAAAAATEVCLKSRTMNIIRFEDELNVRQFSVNVPNCHIHNNRNTLRKCSCH